jgi:hypothetical protein
MYFPKKKEAIVCLYLNFERPSFFTYLSHLVFSGYLPDIRRFQKELSAPCDSH